MRIDETKIVAEGIWMHTGDKPCRVLIIQEEDFFPNTGDDVDPPATPEDPTISYMRIFFENPARKGEFDAGGICRLTLDEAIRDVEDRIGAVAWRPSNP